MDFEKEIMTRANWIKDILAETGAKGIVFGSSGGKDSALVGILSRIATPNVTGIIMPCGSRRNYEKGAYTRTLCSLFCAFKCGGGSFASKCNIF